jgi:hypothetical protein
MIMLDFKIKPLDNVIVDLQELTDYYYIIKANYRHLKWEPELVTGIKNIYSWAIQTNLKDINYLTPPFNLPNEWVTEEQRNIYNIECNTPTTLAFGFAERLLKKFTFAKQCMIIVHGSGFVVPEHIDDSEGLTEDHVKIHVPIISNDQSFFRVDGEDYVMNPGKFYLVNTTRIHSTINLGTTDRAHLIFKIPVSEIENLISNDIVI